MTLAWLLAQGPDIIPIPGSKQIKYIEENLGALDVKLSKDELAEIRTLCDDVEQYLGDSARGPEFIMQMSWVETPLPTDK